MVFAQFSPGELSRAHRKLEGSENCTQCHEVGKEIDGSKCLGCHHEIKKEHDRKHGYHFAVSSRQCVTCHKEHLGRDAKTNLFDEKAFDHVQTSFALNGKHSSTQCEKCHSTKNIKDSIVVKLIAEFPHTSYLGLTVSCASCHEDPHKGRFNQECSSCHNTTAWAKVEHFDHSKAKFPIEGKHAQVECSKCHASLLKNTTTSTVDFTTKIFSDCTPCHNSPHVSKFENRECKSCHTTEKWISVLENSFSHSMTRYKLVGKHVTVRCEQCHHTGTNTTFKTAFLLSFKKCTDCHTDKHNGQFLKAYNNDCAACHTEHGYKPSTYTLTRHEKSSFALTGAHQAVLCGECHRKTESDSLLFHFGGFNCETCHRDIHRGEFSDVMKKVSCAACHSASQWKSTTYDHSKTHFPLVGKHAVVKCIECHQQGATGNPTAPFKKVSSDCQSCHKDVHEKQFASNGRTDCTICHTAISWRSLLFNHETQSSFSLKGAHKKVECNACHRVENLNDRTFRRYKPLNSKCESCHQQGNIK